MKIKKCKGHGQGSCTRCTKKGIWNRTWMSLLSEIDGMPGCYCDMCVKEILQERREK